MFFFRDQWNNKLKMFEIQNFLLTVKISSFIWKEDIINIKCFIIYKMFTFFFFYKKCIPGIQLILLKVILEM